MRAVRLRGHRRRRPHPDRRLEHGLRASGPLPPHRGVARAKLIVVDPRATATARAADLHLALKPGTDVALFNAMLHVLRREGSSIRVHAAPHRRLRGLEPPIAGPRSGREVCGVPAAQIVQAARLFGTRRPRSRSTARVSTSRRAAPSRTARSSTCISPPARSAGRARAVLAHRPAQRHGRARGRRHGQPAVRAPRPISGKAPRRSRRAVGHRQRPGTARQDRGGAVRGDRPRRDQGGVDRLHQPRPIHAGCQRRAQSARARRAGGGAGSLPGRRDLRLRRRAAAGGELGGEGRHRHELRAAHLRVRAAVTPPGEARPDWKIASDFAASSSAPGLLDKPIFVEYETAEAVFNEHRETRAAATSISPGCPTRCSSAKGPQQWPYPQGATPAARACTRTACFQHLPVAHASSPPNTRRPPKRPMPNIRFASPPGACATSGTA